MGSAENLNQAVEALPEIQESLVVGVEQTEGRYWIAVVRGILKSRRAAWTMRAPANH